MDSNILKNSLKPKLLRNKIGEELDLFYLRIMLRQIRELSEMSVNSCPYRESPIVVISEASQ